MFFYSISLTRSDINLISGQYPYLIQTDFKKVTKLFKNRSLPFLSKMFHICFKTIAKTTEPRAKMITIQYIIDRNKLFNNKQFWDSLTRLRFGFSSCSQFLPPSQI